MFHIIEKRYNPEGQETYSDAVIEYPTLAEANNKVGQLYEPCRTEGARYVHDDGGWSIFYVEAG